MKIRKKNISEQEYKDLVHMSGDDAEKKMMEMAPADYKFGYGIYGCRLSALDGFWIEYITGDSCD